METGLFQVIKLVYATLLRPAFAEKIKLTPTHLDDFLLKLLDKIFDYDDNGN